MKEKGGYSIEYRYYGYNWYHKDYRWQYGNATGDGIEEVKEIGWYYWCLTRTTTYYTYLGDIKTELPREQARALAYAKVPEEYKKNDEVLRAMIGYDESQFKKVYREEISRISIFIVFLIVLPFILSLILKIGKPLLNKNKENKKLRELRKINELKDNELISNEEYERRKAQITNKK